MCSAEYKKPGTCAQSNNVPVTYLLRGLFNKIPDCAHVFQCWPINTRSQCVHSTDDSIAHIHDSIAIICMTERNIARSAAAEGFWNFQTNWPITSNMTLPHIPHNTHGIHIIPNSNNNWQVVKEMSRWRQSLLEHQPSIEGLLLLPAALASPSFSSDFQPAA